jgi:hypothetical protein
MLVIPCPLCHLLIRLLLVATPHNNIAAHARAQLQQTCEGNTPEV